MPSKRVECNNTRPHWPRFPYAVPVGRTTARPGNPGRAEREKPSSILDRARRRYVPFLVHSFTGTTLKKIQAAFYRTSAGTEPVRDRLKALRAEDRREVGPDDIATVEYGWPVGMPICRPLGQGLWEVRCNLAGNRTARVIFCIARGQMVLLHGFVKKTQKTSEEDLALARKRMKEIEQ
jgi:phage-related protein